MVENVCLRIWSLNLIYQFLTITYLTQLCGDVKSNPGPNLHNLQTLEDYEKHKANQTNIHALYIQLKEVLTTNWKKFWIFCSNRTLKNAGLLLKHG